MSTTYDLLYRGGVSKENNIRYLTAETPPADDNSNKVPTTEWVQEKMDDVEAAVSGGMFPKVQTPIGSSYPPRVPSGGTWWCYGINTAFDYTNQALAGGATITNTGATQTMCIKIA